MKANYKAKIRDIDVTTIRTALGTVANTAFVKVLRKHIKTEKNAEGVREATHREFARINNLFIADVDEISIATGSDFKRILDYYGIENEYGNTRKWQEGDKLTVKDYGNAFMLLYLLAFYNVQDDYIKQKKKQCQIAAEYCEEYQNIINEYLFVCGDDILKVAKTMQKNIYSPLRGKMTVEAVAKLGALTK